MDATRDWLNERDDGDERGYEYQSEEQRVRKISHDALITGSQARKNTEPAQASFDQLSRTEQKCYNVGKIEDDLYHVRAINGRCP